MALPLQIKEGDRFGRLTIVSETRKTNLKRSKRAFLLSCECGGSIVSTLDSLRIGYTKSCGCIRIEQAKERIKIANKFLNNVTHGLSGSKMYQVFMGIKSRCADKNNKRYNSYGRRGIVCEWNSFEEFYKDMGDSYSEGLEIDRIDVNGNYSKANCRWVLPIENSRNKQNTIWYKGECLANYCRINGLDYKKVWYRISKGIAIEDAVY